jgi:WD40 repeat protein
VATVDGRTLLASASWDGTVRLWDPWTGRPVGEHALRGERGMCFLTAGGRPLLATAGADDSVRLLDLTADARPEVIGTGLVVDALCPVRVGGRSLLAAAENDGPYRHVVRLWDPASRRRPRQMDGGDAAGAMCEVSFGGRTRLAIATANGDPSAFTPGTGTVLLTEPDGRQPPMRAVSHTGPVTALAEVPVGGRTLVASASADHSVRFWDPATGRAVSVADGHVTEVRALSAVPGGLLASAGDTTVRIWNPETGEAVAVLRGHEMAVAAVCPVTVDGRPLIASGGYDRTIRLWDPRTGRTVRVLEHPGGVYVLRTLELDGRTVLVSAGAEGALLLWDPATGSVLRRMEGHTGWISGVCLTGASPLLASAGSDGTVRLWDPGTGSPTQVLAGHTGGARGVCPVTVQGTRLLASAGADAQVRLWDPATGRLRTTIPVRDPATACAEADGTLVVGLDTGVLAVRLAGPRRTGTGAVRGRGREVRGGEPRARRRTYGPCGRGTRRSADRCTGEGPVGTGGGRGHGRSP